MALKLLTRKDASLKHADIDLTMKLGRVLPEHISEMQGLLGSSKAPAEALGVYALRECVSEIEFQGEQLEPRFISYNLDTKDAENKVFLTAIATLVLDELLVTDAAKKKQNSQQEPIGAENAA